MGKKVLSGGPFDDAMWKKYTVRWNFVGKLCGSHPTDPNVFETWLKNKMPSVRPPGGKSVTQLMEEVQKRTETVTEEIAEAERRSTVAFPKLKTDIVVPVFAIRAHLKEATRKVSQRYIGKVEGESSLTTKIIPSLYIEGNAKDEFGTDVVFVTREGKRVTDPDGFLERKVHATDSRGQAINALKRFAYIMNPTMEFTLRILEKSVRLSDLELIFKYGAVQGFAGERSMGEGKYTFEVEG